MCCCFASLVSFRSLFWWRVHSGGLSIEWACVLLSISLSWNGYNRLSVRIKLKVARIDYFFSYEHRADLCIDIIFFLFKSNWNSQTVSIYTTIRYHFHAQIYYFFQHFWQAPTNKSIFFGFYVEDYSLAGRNVCPFCFPKESIKLSLTCVGVTLTTHQRR